MGLSANAQKVVHHQSLYWLYYSNQLNFSPKLYWTNNIDNRRFFNPDVENQFIYHSRLHYRTGRWHFAGGLSFSFIYNQIPENKSSHVATEIRPVAEVSHEQEKELVREYAREFGKGFVEKNLHELSKFATTVRNDVR